MFITMVRHGESHWNVEGRHQGHLDSGLTDRGREQAELVARVLSDDVGPVDRVWSSDLPRALETARAYSRLVGAEVICDPRLREVDVGSWSGHLIADIAKEYPDTVAASAAGQDPRRGGGETFREQRARVEEFLLEHANSGTNDSLVFAHGGTVRVAAAFAARVPSPGHDTMSPPSNCSRTVLELTPKIQRLVRYNLPLLGAPETY